MRCHVLVMEMEFVKGLETVDGYVFKSVPNALD